MDGAARLILSPCLEWLFAEGGRPFAERIRAAAESGFDQVEFWTAGDKDVPLQALIKVMDTVRAAGITTVGIAAKAEKR